jgi:hypothetical protein
LLFSAPVLVPNGRERRRIAAVVTEAHGLGLEAAGDQLVQ